MLLVQSSCDIRGLSRGHLPKSFTDNTRAHQGSEIDFSSGIAVLLLILIRNVERCYLILAHEPLGKSSAFRLFLCLCLSERSQSLATENYTQCLKLFYMIQQSRSQPWLRMHKCVFHNMEC